jgi:signal transduction histidine kinase
MQKQPEDVAHALQSVLNFLAPALNAKRACVSFEAGAMDGRRVLADRNQIEALFSVLLSNALDAIPLEGAIAIWCNADSDEWVEIRIADSGSGISPADQARVFEPFFTTKAPGKGTGLGLAIARNIVMEHGGTIRLESQAGRGTTAFVQLPLLKPEARREAAHR